MAKIIYNRLIPFKGFRAMALVWWIFVRSEVKDFNDTDFRHESIHIRQQKEMFVILFFLWYGIEWIVRLIQYRNSKTAYKKISFEREAYSYQNDLSYLDNRKHYAWIKYLKK